MKLTMLSVCIALAGAVGAAFTANWAAVGWALCAAIWVMNSWAWEKVAREAESRLRHTKTPLRMSPR